MKLVKLNLLSEELDDPDCCLEINDQNELIGLRSIEQSYALARRNGRISVNWLLKAFNKHSTKIYTLIYILPLQLLDNEGTISISADEGKLINSGTLNNKSTANLNNSGTLDISTTGTFWV